MLIILTSFILCFTNPFKYLFYRKVPVILPIPWKDVVSHFNDIGWEPKKTPGDGFCFISSIAQCMESDHNIVLDKCEVQDLIIDQGIENSEQYSNYHFNRTLNKQQTNKHYTILIPLCLNSWTFLRVGTSQRMLWI